MKYLALLFLASSAFAADITINFPAATPRQVYGLQYAVQVANASQTNVVWTLATFNRQLDATLSNQVWVAKHEIIENYAKQRDEVDKGPRLRALRAKIIPANEEQLAAIEAIVATNTPVLNP